MLKFILLLSSLAMGPAALFAADKPAVPGLLTAAAQQAALLTDATKAFVMDVDFTAKFDTARAGHLRLRWESKDRWWTKVTVGPIEQVKFMNGEKTYTLRNIPFTPAQVSSLWTLLHVAEGYEQVSVRKDKHRVENGIRLDCVETEQPYTRREICLNADTREIVNETRNLPGDNVEIVKFSEYAEFGGFRYPHRLELVRNNRTIITANVMELKEEPLDAKLLVPPEGAIERRECAGIKPPTGINHVEPDFHGAPSPTGSTQMAVTVLADGTVGEVHVIESGGPQLDSMVMEMVKKQKYRPAMCGSEPVVADIQVELLFQRD